MLEARRQHGSCSQGDYVYVSCGHSWNEQLRNFERLNLKAFLAGQAVSWEQVPVDGLMRLLPRTDHVMVTLSEREILILGGEKSGKIGDGYILQTVPVPKKKINMKLFGL